MMYMFMGCAVAFQYMYVVCDDQAKVIGIYVPADIYHFFVLGSFAILSTSFFEIISC